MRLPLIVFTCLVLFSCKTNYIKYKPQQKYTCEPSDTNNIHTALDFSGRDLQQETAVLSLDNDVISLTSRAWLCDHAKKTLDIQYYIFSRDRIGLISFDYLVRAADRGVKIRMIIDDATVKSGKREILMLDSHENIEIRIYNPGIMLEKNVFIRLYKIVFQSRKMNMRMHNKTLTVDNVVSITGGRNIADEYYSFNKRYNFRDRDVLLAGAETEKVTQSFNEFWDHELSVPIRNLVGKYPGKSKHPNRYDKLHQYACDPSNFSNEMREKISQFPARFRELEREEEVVWTEQVDFVADLPGKREFSEDRKRGVSTDSLLSLLQRAKRTVDIQSSYLITTDEGKAMLKTLVERGVRVRVLTNSLGSTDNYEAFNGYQRDREATLKTGIEVYEFRPDAKVRYELLSKEMQSALSYTPVYGLHSKTMTIDDEISVIGSYNMDPRSVNYNTECIVIVRNKQVTANLRKWIEKEIQPENAWKITPDFNPDKEAGGKKLMNAASRRVIPKKIL